MIKYNVICKLDSKFPYLLKYFKWIALIKIPLAGYIYIRMYKYLNQGDGLMS